MFAGWTGTEIDSATTTVRIPIGSTGNREYTANWILLEMKPITAGTFIMGSPVEELGRENDEIQHQVTLTQDFYMGKYEVTQEQYFSVMGTNPSHYNGLGYDVMPTTTASAPVQNVSWDSITAESNGFLTRLNAQMSNYLPAGYHFDLPTEAQWEYACRAGTTSALNNGKELSSVTELCPNLDEVAWYNKNSNHPRKVGLKQPNAWGLYDMHGNVWEWCKDKYGDYPATDVIDQVGVGSLGIIRGGSFFQIPERARSSERYTRPTSGPAGDIGFRLVIVPIP